MRTTFEPQSVSHQLPVTDIPAPRSTVVHQFHESSGVSVEAQGCHLTQVPLTRKRNLLGEIFFLVVTGAVWTLLAGKEEELVGVVKDISKECLSERLGHRNECKSGPPRSRSAHRSSMCQCRRFWRSCLAGTNATADRRGPVRICEVCLTGTSAIADRRGAVDGEFSQERISERAPRRASAGESGDPA